MDWERETLTCVLCGRSEAGTLPDMHRVGWDWIKGYLPKRLECCPKCAAIPEWTVEKTMAHTPPSAAPSRTRG